jgi:hypothetical protein
MYTYPYITKKRRKKNVYFFFWKTSFDPPYRGVSVQNSEINIPMGNRLNNRNRNRNLDKIFQ